MADLNSPAFQRAFAAISYLMGRRGAELLEPLGVAHDEARAVVRVLGHEPRERRAEVLARELRRVALAIEARSIK